MLFLVETACNMPLRKFFCILAYHNQNNHRYRQSIYEWIDKRPRMSGYKLSFPEYKLTYTQSGSLFPVEKKQSEQTCRHAGNNTCPDT